MIRIDSSKYILKTLDEGKIDLKRHWKQLF